MLGRRVRHDRLRRRVGRRQQFRRRRVSAPPSLEGPDACGIARTLGTPRHRLRHPSASSVRPPTRLLQLSAPDSTDSTCDNYHVDIRPPEPSTSSSSPCTAATAPPSSAPARPPSPVHQLHHRLGDHRRRCPAGRWTRTTSPSVGQQQLVLLRVSRVSGFLRAARVRSPHHQRRLLSVALRPATRRAQAHLDRSGSAACWPSATESVGFLNPAASAGRSLAVVMLPVLEGRSPRRRMRRAVRRAQPERRPRRERRSRLGRQPGFLTARRTRGVVGSGGPSPCRRRTRQGNRGTPHAGQRPDRRPDRTPPEDQANVPQSPLPSAGSRSARYGASPHPTSARSRASQEPTAIGRAERTPASARKTPPQRRAGQIGRRTASGAVAPARSP